MLTCRRYRLATLLLPPLVCAVAFAAAEPPLSAEPRTALAEAFHRRYDCDSRQSLTLVLRANGREFQRQKIGVATKFVAGRMRALGRFTDPPDLRDTAVLMLEGEDPSGSDQLFVFLPMLGRVRRVSGAQRGDSFMGTDLTYEDLQRPRVEDYTDFSERDEELEGEPAVVVTARPVRSTYYDRIETWIARRDAAILRVRFFKQDSAEPFKIIETPRQVLVRDGDNVVPKRLMVVNVSRKTETEVFVDQLELHAKTDDNAFTTNALVMERDVPKPATRAAGPHEDGRR
jgi:hypothetical protein